MKHADELKNLLRQCSGGDCIYKHSMVKSFVYTEGAREFFQNAGDGAYWLADILATEPAIRRGVAEHGLCVVLLDVKGRKATLTVSVDLITDKDAAGEVTGYRPQSIQFQRAIDYTDCPEGFWKLYLDRTELEGGAEVMICLLPQEY